MLTVDIEKRLGEFDAKVAFESKGGVTALFGSSGSGKTSVVNMIAGLIKPDRGLIALDDHVLFDSKAHVNVPMHRRRIGYVFQDGRLFPHLSVEENLSYALQRSTRGARRPAIDLASAVDALDLAALLTRGTTSLSGGEQQRVAIARALVSRPALLLADEPTGNLDRRTGEEVLALLLARAKERGAAVLLATHDPAVAAACGRTLRLHEGLVVAP
jgi:molybdate transport system ATP-binding protein